MSHSSITVTRNVTVGIRCAGSLWNFGQEEQDFPVVQGNSWGNTVIIGTDEELSVIVCGAPNIELRDNLVNTYGIVVQTRLRSYQQYLYRLRDRINELIGRYRRGNPQPSPSMNEYLRALGNMSELGTLQDSRLSSSGTDGVVYIIGIPKYLMANLWGKYVNPTINELLAHVLTDEGTQTVDIVSEVAPLCDRYETLLSDGCLACTNRNRCVEHLLQTDLSVTEGTSADLIAVKKLLRGYPLIPQSDCVDYRTNSKIDVRDLDMRDALDKNAQRSKARKNVAENVSFAAKNCLKCTLQKSCGTAGGYGTTKIGVNSFCAGKTTKDLLITEDNYLEVFKVVFRSMLLASNSRHTSVDECLKILKSWIDSSGYLPPDAAYYSRKLREARQSNVGHMARYVIPSQLLKLSNLVELSGSFELGGRPWGSLGIGTWLSDSTSEISAFTNSQKGKGKWYAISPTSYSWARHMSPLAILHPCIDTSVLADVEMAPLKSGSRIYKTAQARIRLAAEFVALFMSPGRVMWHGPFACRKSHLPSGIPGRRSEFPQESAEYNLMLALSRFKEVNGGKWSEDQTLKVLESNNALKEHLC